MEQDEAVATALRTFQQVTGLEAVQRAEGDGTVVRLGEAGPLRVRRAGVVVPGDVDRTLAGYERGDLLLADRVTPRAAEALRDRDVPFLDRAGNVFVRTSSTFVYVCGRDTAGRQRAVAGAQAFRPKGLRVVFALLCRADGLDASYRELAHDAGVALGTVTGVMRDLERLGYLRQRGRKRHWENRAGLQQEWARVFPRELRPRLEARRYRVDRVDWWRATDPRRFGFRLGAEAAAAWMTGILEPGEVTLYGSGDFDGLAADIRPIRDEAGNLEVLDAFWHFEQAPDPGPIVPPLLVYADLLASAADRAREVAHEFREQFVA